MKILFFGDSCTDMGRDRTLDYGIKSYGTGYVFFVAGTLTCEDPSKYQIVNRGVSGDRIVDLYARIKRDVWDEKPDVLTIMIGINDVWHDVGERPNGVELPRFEKFYRMIIEETKERLPGVKIILMRPAYIHGAAMDPIFEHMRKEKEYAAVTEKIAKEYGLPLVDLQKKFDESEKKAGPVYFMYDGVHPAVGGAKLIADAWLEAFRKL